MRPECIAEVAKAIGRTPTSEEIKAFDDGLLAQARELARRDPEQWQSMSANERVQAMAEAAQKEALATAKKQADRKLLNVLAQAQNSRQIAARAQEFAAAGKKNPTHKAVFEWLRNIDGYIGGLRNELVGNIFQSLEAIQPKFLGLFTDKASEQAFLKALLDGDKSNAAMTKAAKIYSEAMEKIRLRANRG